MLPVALVGGGKLLAVIVHAEAAGSSWSLIQTELWLVKFPCNTQENATNATLLGCKVPLLGIFLFNDN